MMKKRNGILTGLIAACAACVISAAGCSQSPQTSNKPTEATTMATVWVRYIVDDIDAAIEFYTRLTELASVRYPIGDARAAIAVAGITPALSRICYSLAAPSPNERSIPAWSAQRVRRE